MHDISWRGINLFKKELKSHSKNLTFFCTNLLQSVAELLYRNLHKIRTAKSLNSYRLHHLKSIKLILQWKVHDVSCSCGVFYWADILIREGHKGSWYPSSLSIWSREAASTGQKCVPYRQMGNTEKEEMRTKIFARKRESTETKNHSSAVQGSKNK